MRDQEQDRGRNHEQNQDYMRQLLDRSGEPAPVDLAGFRKRVGEIIARAMQAFGVRRKADN
jgi:hypothetical protein